MGVGQGDEKSEKFSQTRKPIRDEGCSYREDKKKWCDARKDMKTKLHNQNNIRWDAVTRVVEQSFQLSGESLYPAFRKVPPFLAC